MQNDKKEFEIIFLGLAQNCENYLDNIFKKIDEISYKKKIKIFIGENGSNDFTFDKIQKKISVNKIYNFIDTTFIEKYQDRIKRLANARQSLIEKIIQLNIKSDYICVVDLDDVINDQFNLNLINSLCEILKKNQDKYFGISLNSKPYYYDILNFESEEFPNTNIKQLQNNKSINSYRNRKKFIYDVQKKISKKKIFEAISAFNGLCIYKFDEFITSKYLEDKKDQTPEHLYFNRRLNKHFNKKILVTDNYFNMPKEHKPLNNIFQFSFEKIVKYLTIYHGKIFD
jgi:hypothetical protein